MPNGRLNGAVAGTDAGDWFGVVAGVQPVAIAPSPANEHDYYVFYWERGPANGQYALNWVRVDMRLHGGLGDVAARGTQPLALTSRPRLTIVRHANNRDFWVLTRGLDARAFQAVPLTGAGPQAGAVVESLAGQAAEPDLGELKAAPNGRRLACGARVRAGAPAEQLVCVYDFDPATGQVSQELVAYRRPVPDPGYIPDDYGVSSCSFSPSSELLYTVEYRPGGGQRWTDLWQYDLRQPTAAAVAASRYAVTTGPVPTGDVLNCYGLQLTPHGQVWAGQCYMPRLADPAPRRAAGTIRRPDVAGPGCDFLARGYAYLPGQLPASTFPNVITNMLYAKPALNYEVGCGEDSVRFWASSAGLGAGLRWDFGEPGSGAANTASGRWVAHRYARGGTYLVRLTLADGRQLTQTVEVPVQASDFTQQNIFTPNGDGLNEWFEPVRGGGLAQGRLRVYARWGQLVADTAGPLPRWDGAGAAGGVYFYLLEYADCQGQPRQRRGTITLIR